jgi:starvation-inducible DNA-binding protein
MKAEIGITSKNLDIVSEILNTWLADEYLLATKTKNYHWNVTGSNFYGLHTLFGEQYKILDQQIDMIAERIRVLGHFAVGNMTDFLKMTHLSETKNEDLTASNMIALLLQDHQLIVRMLRTQAKTLSEKHKDEGTADFMLDIMKEHEKMAWMLRAFLEE